VDFLQSMQCEEADSMIAEPNSHFWEHRVGTCPREAHRSNELQSPCTCIRVAYRRNERVSGRESDD
jgi:hypothetical protein